MSAIVIVDEQSSVMCNQEYYGGASETRAA